MVVLQHVVAPDGVAAGRGYSQVVTGHGRLVVVSGQIAQDERGELVGAGDPAAQARQVFEKLATAAWPTGRACFDDVVKWDLPRSDVADLAVGTCRPRRRHRYAGRRPAGRPGGPGQPDELTRA